MAGFVALALPLADAAEEGRNIILGMLLTGLVFVGTIALGELFRWNGRRRKRRRQQTIY